MKVYNTGKVQIGLAYNPTRRVYHDFDAILIQLALTQKPRTFWQKLWGWL